MLSDYFECDTCLGLGKKVYPWLMSDDEDSDLKMRDQELKLVEKENNIEREKNEKLKKVLNDYYGDDGLSLLTAEEYLKYRLLPYLAVYTDITPGISRRITVVSIIVVILTVGSSVLTTFGQTLFIPIAMAFAATITSWQSYHQTEQKLIQTNSAILVLNQLLVWWDALSLIEKRSAHVKKALVLTTESAIQAQVVYYAAKNQQNKENENDESLFKGE